MMKRLSYIAIVIFLWFLGPILFLNPIQCFIYFLMIGLFIWVVTRSRFQTIIRQHGSFQNYIDTLDKSDKYVRTITELTNKFSWLRLPLVRIFFYCAREDITLLTNYIQEYKSEIKF